MAARWRMRSARFATSFSAPPATERSDTIELPWNGTTSCRMSSASASLARRAVSLRPIMPAAPMTRMRCVNRPSPVGIPDAPPGCVALVAADLEVAAVGEVRAHHAVGAVAQLIHAEGVVRLDEDEDRFFERGRIRVVANRVLRAVGGSDVGTALHVVAGDVHFVRGEGVDEVV